MPATAVLQGCKPPGQASAASDGEPVSNDADLVAAEASLAAGSDGLLPVAICVPYCPLQFGEQLCLVGSCAELGAWDAASAPLLQWQEGDNWVATLSLPPGEHACKLVLVRLDGSLHWEDGDDRALPVPATEGGAAVMASLRYGNTASTHVEVPQQPAEVAAARVAALQQRTRRLSAQMDALENEVAQR